MYITDSDDLSVINTTIVMKVFPDGCIGYDLGSTQHSDILSKRLDYGIFTPIATGPMFRVATAYLESIYDVAPVITPEFSMYCDKFRDEVKVNKKRDDAIIKNIKQSLYNNTKTSETEDED